MNKRSRCLSIQFVLSVFDHQVGEVECLERKKFVISSKHQYSYQVCFPIAVVVAAASVVVAAAAAVGAVTLARISETILAASWSCSSYLDFHHQKSFDAA